VTPAPPVPSDVKLLIDRNQLKTPVYVGDTEGDRTAARECGIPFWFVDYGFGQCTEFDQKFSCFEDLLEVAYRTKADNKETR
jgi:phosphoglycolate phosphatase